MTYPPQPPHPSQAPDPQQAYAAQYPPQPGYVQPPPVQVAPVQVAPYPPPPAVQNYPPAPATAAYVQPNVVEPTGGGGGVAPLPRNLYGYAVMCLPTAYEPNNIGPGGNVKPRVTVDFVVVGVDPQGNPLPPIEFGESQDRDQSKQRPACYRLDAFPAEFRGAWWSNEQIVKWLAPLVGTGNVTMGRIRQGDSTNRPPLFEVMAADDAARAALNAAWQQRTLQPGSLVRSVGNGIVEINGGPPQKQPAGQPAPQQGMPQGYPPPHGHGYGGPPPPPAPGAQVNYGYPPAPGQPGQPSAPGQPYVPGPYTQQVLAMPPAAAQAGWTQDAWNNAPPQVKAAFGG